MSSALEEAKRLASTKYDTDKAIAWALIAVAEELKQISYINELILHQTQIGVNVFTKE